MRSAWHVSKKPYILKGACLRRLIGLTSNSPQWAMLELRLTPWGTSCESLMKLDCAHILPNCMYSLLVLFPGKRNIWAFSVGGSGLQDLLAGASYFELLEPPVLDFNFSIWIHDCAFPRIVVKILLSPRTAEMRVSRSRCTSLSKH